MKKTDRQKRIYEKPEILELELTDCPELLQASAELDVTYYEEDF